MGRKSVQIMKSNKRKNPKIQKNGKQILPDSLWRFYFKYAFRGYWWRLFLYTVLFAITMSDAVLYPMLQKAFIALFEKTVPANMSFLEFAMPTIFLFVLMFILWDVCFYLRTTVFAHWKPQIEQKISEFLTDYSHAQSMSFWTGRMAGSINSQINYVSQGLNCIEHFLRMFFSIGVIAINVVLILGINKWVAIIFACVFVFRLIFGIAMLKPMQSAAKAASSSKSFLSGKIVDSVSNFSVVKLFAGAKIEHEHLDAPRKKSIKDTVKSLFLSRLFWSVPNIVWDIAFGCTLVLCVTLYMNGEMLLSDIVFTTSVFFSVMGLIAQIVNTIPPIVEALGSASKAYSELVVPVDITDIDNAPDLVVKNGKIEIKHLFFKYKKKWILKDFNLTIKPGERVGLVGPSGAGKTTLVNLLMRFYDPNKGDILIDGQNIRDVSQDSLRKNISFIPQEPTMFNRTLRENIEYGKPGATKKEIIFAAKEASAHDFIMGTEKKYDSMVGDRGIKLSGGQRQRVAIARAFLKNSPILILDEATSALDSETEVAIQKSFDVLARGRTTLAIAHRLSTLRNMDKIVVMKNGRIVEQGTHNTLLKKRGEYWRLWNMQSGGFLQD